MFGMTFSSAAGKSAIISRAFVMSTALGCFAAAVLRIPYWLNSYPMLVVCGFAGAALVVAFALAHTALRASRSSVTRVIQEVILIGIVLLCVEMLLISAQPATWTNDADARRYLLRWHAAEQLGIKFDTRMGSKVVESLRTQGLDAFPSVSGAWPRAPQVRALLPSGFYPLSNASNAQIVECNESGNYLVYESDEFGFNNPAGLIAAGELDVAVIGESHMLGHCVPPGQSLVDVVRAAIPRTATFAMAGTRSLAQLGSFREYVEPLKPPLVLWGVNEGYAYDAADESSDPVLQRYLDPSFSQGLINRQHEVNILIRQLSITVQAEKDRLTQAEIQRATDQKYSRVFVLRRVREGMDPGKYFKGSSLEKLGIESDGIFEQSLRLANEAVQSWGGRLVVLILPTFNNLERGDVHPIRHRSITDSLNKLNIEFIDGASLFLSVQDATGLYTMRIQNHPNAAGHALLGGAVTEKLRSRLSLNYQAPSHGRAIAGVESELVR